jgi:hypothetical protein
MGPWITQHQSSKQHSTNQLIQLSMLTLGFDLKVGTCGFCSFPASVSFSVNEGSRSSITQLHFSSLVALLFGTRAKLLSPFLAVMSLEDVDRLIRIVTRSFYPVDVCVVAEGLIKFGKCVGCFLFCFFSFLA